MAATARKTRATIKEQRIDISRRLALISSNAEPIPSHYSLNVKTGGPSDGPALVFLHGCGGESGNFREQLEYFAGLGYRVIAIDGNGSGKSDFRKISVWRKRLGLCPRPHREHAYDIHAALDELGVGNAAFIGHSDGAQTAQTYAVLYPESVKGLVLVGGQTHYMLFDRFYNALISIVTPDADQYPRSVLWAVSKLFFSDEHARSEFLKDNRVPSPKAMRNWVLSFDHFSSPRHPPKIPTLVMYGEQDTLTKGEQAPLAKSWKAGIVPIPGAGHLPFWEQPLSFNHKLTEFLEKIGWVSR